MTVLPGARACPRLFSPFALDRLALPNRFTENLAHPGFRDVARRALGRLGATIVVSAPAGPAAQTLGTGSLVVPGRDPHLWWDDPAAWRAVPGAGVADDDFGDAWEPGRMTQTVYEADARAASLDGGAVPAGPAPA